MSYLSPKEFVTKMVDSGESKLTMSLRDTLIRSYMAGAIIFRITDQYRTQQAFAIVRGD